MTTGQKLDMSREVRLWIRDIVVPAAGVAVAALSIPEVRNMVNDKVKDIRDNIERKRTVKRLSNLEVRK